jgi:hypothetical protein
MKQNLLILLLFISTLSFAQWQFEGTAQFTNNALDVAIATDVNDVPYVAYSDITDGLLHVKKFDGANWVDVGVNATGLVIPTLIDIAINPVTGHPWVVYKNDNTNRLDVVKFDGTNWSTEIASLNNFNPHSKTILKFSPAGAAVIGTSRAGSTITNSTFYLYSNRSGSWTSEFNRTIFEHSYDVISHNKFVVGWGYLFGNWRPRATTYVYSSSAWNISANTFFLPPGGANAYMYTLAADNDKILHHYNYQGNTSTNRFEFIGGVRPSGANNPTKRTSFLEQSPLDLKYYALYYKSNHDLAIQQYNEFVDSWTDLNIGLNFTGTDPQADLAINTSGNKVYVAYLDNDKVSVQYYSIATSVNQVYVDIDATGNNDGSSWANAYTDIQDAINNTSLPTQIWVAEGTYLPTEGTGNYSTFKIENTSVALYGGFNGTETALNQRDYKNNITILSGDLNGNDNANINHTESSRADNAYHVVSFKRAGIGSVIDGFTIEGGNANGSLANDCSNPPSTYNDARRGGAIYVQPYNGGTIEATIKNCVLEKNTGSDTAVFSPLLGCGQSGIDSDIDFESCIVRNNRSGSNSAFLFVGSSGYSQYSRGSIVNCLFYDNISTSGASTIFFATSTSNNGNANGIDVDVVNSTFANNISGIGKVIKMTRAGNTTISNSIIYNNGSVIPFDVTGSTSVISNTIVQGGQLGGSGQDPLFVDGANADFTLQLGSPAIDAGDNSKIPANITIDLLGYVRIHNTTVDMGAYEYNPSLSLDSHESIMTLKLYPNPTSSILNIESDTPINQIKVLNVLGEEILKTTSKTIDVSQLNQGVYLIEIKGNNNQTIIKRFIKQ